MRLQFFRISVLSDRDDAEELNKFLASHRVVSIDRQLVADGQNSFWTICVNWLEGAAAKSSGSGDRAKVDYREVLPEEEFRVFAKLRTIRKELANRDGVPAYALFTNEQLAQMVRRRITSLSGLSEIEGIGTGRIAKYGERFLSELEREFAGPTTLERSSEDETNAHPAK